MKRKEKRRSRRHNRDAEGFPFRLNPLFYFRFPGAIFLGTCSLRAPDIAEAAVRAVDGALSDLQATLAISGRVSVEVAPAVTDSIGYTSPGEWQRIEVHGTPTWELSPHFPSNKDD